MALAPGADNRQCPYYIPRDPNQTVNCPNCKRWIGVECQGHQTFLRIRDEKKIDRLEGLMRHDGFKRSGGAIKQVRRGS